MKTVTDLSRLRTEKRLACLALGVFDGVHRGHRQIVRRTVARAAREGGEAWILSFDAHPDKVLRPRFAPALLTSTPHKLDILAELGIDGCVLVHFTPRFATMEPETFVARLCKTAPGLRAIFVGKDWRFGKAGRGDVALLSREAGRHGIAVEAVPPVRWRGAVISSTRIRNAIGQGKLKAAAAMLGRPFSLMGNVVHGKRIGRKLGFPTANIDPHNEACPPIGVYAVRARLAGRTYDGVISIGLRPTFEHGKGRRVTVELHLLDFARNIYGKTIEVFFLARLRGERRFASARDLAAQIARDIAKAREILARENLRKARKNTLQAPPSQI